MLDNVYSGRQEGEKEESNRGYGVKFEHCELQTKLILISLV